MSEEEEGEALLLEDLSFPLNDINSLSNTQLCLVQFHPEADEIAKSKAELVYYRRWVHVNRAACRKEKNE